MLKTIAAFLNCGGGNLLIGVDDAKVPLGLDADEFADEDKLMLHLVNLIKDRIGAQHAQCISGRFEEVEGKRVLVITCTHSREVAYVRDGQAEAFFRSTFRIDIGAQAKLSDSAVHSKPHPRVVSSQSRNSSRFNASATDVIALTAMSVARMAD